MLVRSATRPVDRRPLAPPSREADGRLLDLGPDAAPGCGIPFVFVLGIALVLALMLSAGAIAILFGPGGPLEHMRLFPDDGGGGAGGGSPTPVAGAVYRGSDQSGDLPLISIRDFTAGDAPITTSGTFTLSETMPMHPPATFADGTETTLIYGDLLGDYINLGFSNLDGSEGLGLNVQSGDWMAVYQGVGCAWEVRVTDSSVSGHISCTDIPAYNQASGATGSIDLELDFTADSVAVPGASGD